MPSPTTVYSDEEIMRRIDGCPKLASLQSINRALAELTQSEISYSSQIAEVIRRDPSLTSRLLKMVNSVYFGLTAKVNSIEEAVFYLGMRQIRELSMATPVIEELEKIQRAPIKLPWKEFWKHSIGTALMTRELLSNTNVYVDDDTDYIIGLLHNIGKIVMSHAFTEEFRLIVTSPAQSTLEICAMERERIGWDHARIGGYYLERHKLAPEITMSVRFHNEPEGAEQNSFFAAAVQVADHLVRFAGIPGGMEQLPPPADESWTALAGWNILFGEGQKENEIARAAVSNSIQRLPSMLKGLI